MDLSQEVVRTSKRLSIIELHWALVGHTDRRVNQGGFVVGRT